MAETETDLDRLELFLRAALLEIVRNGGRLSGRIAIDIAGKAVPKTPRDLELTPKGRPKWDDYLDRRASWCVSAGFLQRKGGIWTITELGRKALDLSPGRLIRLAHHAASGGAIEVIQSEIAVVSGRAGSTRFDEQAVISLLLADDFGVPEGELLEMVIRHRRREAQLRDKKVASVLSQSGCLVCEVPDCGFDFLEIYGEVGRGYAHVHHLNPLADRSEPSVTHLSDLVIVCANCHAMIHRHAQNRNYRTLLSNKQTI